MKSTRFNLSLATSLVAALLLLVTSLTVTACKNDSDDFVIPDGVTVLEDGFILANTKWQDDFVTWNNYNNSEYDFYVTDSYIETASYGKQETTIYQGKLSETEGFLYYQIVDTSSFAYSSKDPSSYEGKWYGVYYNNLSENSVNIADAMPATYTTDYAAFDSLEAAVQGFTADSGYFGYCPTFTKVSE